MILIAAMTEDRAIGAGDGMPWDVPEEYQHFRDTVRGGTIIMGRRSYEIFGPDLTTRHAIVLTRGEAVPGATETVASLEGALEAARRLGGELFCGGGANVYAQCLPLATEMHLSTIKPPFVAPGSEADAWFPEFSPADWRVAEQRDEPRYRFVRYARR